MSGTEPLLRVMAEGEDEAMVSRIVAQLCETIHSGSDARARVNRLGQPAVS